MIKKSDYVDQFKRDLKSYSFKKLELIEINDNIHALEVRMYEASGISYEHKEPTSSPNAYKTPMQNEMHLMEQLQSKKKFIEWWILEMDKKINLLGEQMKSIILDCYVFKKSHDIVAFDNGYNHNVQMYRDIEKEILKIVIE